MSLVEVVKKMDFGQEEKKVDPPPIWCKDMSFKAWSRSVRHWAEVKASPLRKALVLLEILKKDDALKGVKEMITQEIIEDTEFDLKNELVIEKIPEKIESYVEETRWARDVVLAREMANF